jgi:hypothetical protein
MPKGGFARVPSRLVSKLSNAPPVSKVCLLVERLPANFIRRYAVWHGRYSKSCLKITSQSGVSIGIETIASLCHSRQGCRRSGRPR